MLLLTGSEKLRGLIYSVAQLMTIDGKRNSPRVMGEKIPSSYLTLAKMVDEKRAELEAKQSLPLLRRCQFQDLVEENATKHPQDYFDPEDIDIATEFLHNIGGYSVLLQSMFKFLLLCTPLHSG